MTTPPLSDADDRPIEVLPHAPDPAWYRRLRSPVEVLLCSGIPTQLLVAQALALGGLRPFGAGGALEPTWVFLLACIATVLIVALAVFLLRANGESPSEVFLGSRSPVREAIVGVGLIGPLIFAVAGLMVAAREVWPS